MSTETIEASEARASQRVHRSFWPLTFVACLGFALLMVYTQVVPLGSVPYSLGLKGQDSAQMIWNVWHSSEAVIHGRNPYYTDQLFYPLGTSLAHHTLAPGFFPITLVVRVLSGNSPIYPVYAYRIIILLSFTLLLFFTFQFLRELGFQLIVSLTMAVAYAFCDFYMLHFIHLNHIAGFFIPLTAWLLVRWYKRPTFPNLLAPALSAAVAAYFTEFTIYIYLAALLMFVILCLFRNERQELISRLRQSGFARIAIALAVFLLVLTPFLYVLFTDEVRKPPRYEISHCSANLVGFVIPGGQEIDEPVLFAETNATPLYGRIFSSIESKVTVGHGGYEAFIGFPLLLCSLIGILTSRNKLILASFILAVIFLLLCLGPTLKILSSDTNIPMPYLAIMKVPPFDAGRTPVRFISMALLPLVVVGAVGLSKLSSFVERKSSQNLAMLLLVIVFGWTVAESYSPVQQAQSFQKPAEIQRLVPGAVLHIPPVQWDGYAALLQTQHHQPIDTGYVARNSETQYAYFSELRRAFDKGGEYFCRTAKQVGFRNVLIEPASVVLPYKYSTMPLRLEECDINVVDLRKLDSDFSEERAKPFPPYEWGTRIDFGSAEADKYLWYGWSGREPSSHWTDRGSAAIVFALHDIQPAQLKIRMAPFVAPPRLNSQRVVLTLNGHRVGELTLTNKAAEDLSFELPITALQKENVLVFELPDAEHPNRLGVSADTRLLGVNVQWIEID